MRRPRPEDGHAGTALLGWARHAVTDWARIRDEIGAMQGRASGLVRIATNDYAASAYLPTLLASFAERQPTLEIHTSVLASSHLTAEHIIFIVIASGMAAVGLLQDNEVLVLAAFFISPLRN